jgi:hypothetical protein
MGMSLADLSKRADVLQLFYQQIGIILTVALDPTATIA